ncbi:MAG: mechanosensitive ion channel family protein [Pseudomonadota bacterium]|nr:mechanosensitive ion channel family protein [Pseudomonadota bacterium]
MNDLIKLITSTEVSLQVTAIIIFAFLFLFLKNQILYLLSGISSKTKTRVDDIIIESLKAPLSFLIILVSFILITDIFHEHYQITLFIPLKKLFHLFIIFIFAWTLIRIINNYQKEEIYLDKLTPDDDPKIIRQTYEISLRVAKAIIVVITILVIMQDYGISISGILAFGGVGGLVVGLAAKDLLSNFFGGLMIFFDRPFRVGEFIKSPDRNIEGIVEKIGWRLTVVRTFSKNVLYVPNSAFSNIIVENATRMTNRRINEIIGLRYDDIDKIPMIVDEVRDYLSSHKNIDQTHKPVVYFKSFSPSSCDFFVYAFTITKEWREFLSIKESVLYKISKIVNKHDAAIAYPTTTIDWQQNQKK